MPVEYERKYVLGDAEAAEAACVREGMERLDLQQFYVADGCRFRRVGRPGRPAEHFFTFKRDCGGRLLEVEADVAGEDYALALTQATAVLTKTRYDMAAGDAHWSVDFLRLVTGRAYFALAEAETPEGASAPVPAFLARFVELEVPHAHNPLFANARLIDPAYAARCVADYRSGALS